MKRVSVAEAKNTLPALLHEVENGPVETVRHGKPVAVLLSRSSYDRLRDKHEGVWAALERFRETHDLEELSAASAFEGLRDKSPAGRSLPDGKRKDGLRAYLRDVVTKLTILAYDEKAAQWHARERVCLDTAGKPMPYADGQIIAVAAVHGLTLVTNNERDFRYVEGVRVENWFSR